MAGELLDNRGRGEAEWNWPAIHPEGRKFGLIATGESLFRHPVVVAVWVAAIAVLMISNLATLSWTSIRPRRSIRLEAIGLAGLVFAALLTEPWWTLVGLCVVYLGLMPYGIVRYARIRRQRSAGSAALASANTTQD